MNAEIQTIAALAVVALASSWLALRALGRRSSSGCGGGCGCPTTKLKR